METKFPSNPGLGKAGNVVIPGASTRKKACLLMSDGVKLCAWLMCERQEIVFSRQLLKCLSLVDQFAKMTAKTEEKYFLSGYNKVQNGIKSVEFWLKHIQDMPYLSPGEYKAVVEKVDDLISIIVSVSEEKMDVYIRMNVTPADKNTTKKKQEEVFSVMVRRKKTPGKLAGNEAKESVDKNKKSNYPGKMIPYGEG